jgi:hypothetical protein
MRITMNIGFHIAVCTLTVLISVVLPCSALGETGQAEESEATPEKKVIPIYVDPVQSITPTVDISFPSGIFYMHFEQNFDILEMVFNFNYNFFNDSLESRVSFAYPFRRFIPSVGFSGDLDFENVIAPRIVGGDVYLAPTDKYVSRVRSVDLNLGYNVLENFYLTNFFIISDIYRVSLTTGTVLDKGVDLTERVGFIYNTLGVKELPKKIEVEGFYFRSLFSFRYRNSFNNPLSIDNHNVSLLNTNIRDRLFIEGKLSLNYPIKVYDKEKLNYYQLGGFDNIRGYGQGAINGVWFLLLGTNLELEILRDREIQIRKSKRNTTIHQFTLLFLSDGLFEQDRLNIHSPLYFHSSLGGGFSFLITRDEKKHLKVAVYAAQPLERGFSPIIYMRSTLFNFEIEK